MELSIPDLGAIGEMIGPINSVYRQARDRGELKNFLADDFREYLAGIIKSAQLPQS